MTPGMAEHVVVTKRAPDGLIMEFVKTEIGLPAAEYLKAKAFIETEKSKEKALLGETQTLLEKAYSLRDRPAKTAKLPPPAAPVRPAPVAPAPAVDRRSPLRCAQKEKQAAAARRELAAAEEELKELMRRRDELLDAEIRLVSMIKESAEQAGHHIGKTWMAKSLAPHEDSPIGSRADIEREQMDETVRTVLAQLREQEYFPVMGTENADAFCKAFRAGAHTVIYEFNDRKDARICALRAEKEVCEA